MAGTSKPTSGWVLILLSLLIFAVLALISEKNYYDRKLDQRDEKTPSDSSTAAPSKKSEVPPQKKEAEKKNGRFQWLIDIMKSFDKAIEDKPADKKPETGDKEKKTHQTKGSNRDTTLRAANTKSQPIARPLENAAATSRATTSATQLEIRKKTELPKTAEKRVEPIKKEEEAQREIKLSVKPNTEGIKSRIETPTFFDSLKVLLGTASIPERFKNQIFWSDRSSSMPPHPNSIGEIYQFFWDMPDINKQIKRETQGGGRKFDTKVLCLINGSRIGTLSETNWKKEEPLMLLIDARGAKARVYAVLHSDRNKTRNGGAQ